MRWPLSRLQIAILALVVFDAMLVGWRSEVVRLLPQTASFYAMIGLPVNLRGLAFDGVTTATEQHEGVPVLRGGGQHRQRRAQAGRGAAAQVRGAQRYRQRDLFLDRVPPRTVLPPGEALAFRSRLASPPPEGRDVLVRFFTRRDLVAGLR